MSVQNPFFKYINEHRDTFMRYLYKPYIGRIKIYENAKRIPLPTAASIDMSLSDAVSKRISQTSFSETPVSLSDLSTLLYWSAGELGVREDGQGNVKEKSYRAHPSGGAKYPLETYVFIDQEFEHPRGFYHYRPDHHSLELVHVAEDPEEQLTFKRSFSYEWVLNAPVVVLFSLVVERNMPKYGSLAYKLGLIEAGHIGQNVYLASAALGLSCCALGGMKEELGHTYLSIDGYNESLFYAVALGVEPAKDDIVQKDR